MCSNPGPTLGGIRDSYVISHLKCVAEPQGGNESGGFVKVDIGIRFEKGIKPVDSKIFESEGISIPQDGKEARAEITAGFIENRVSAVIPFGFH